MLSKYIYVILNFIMKFLPSFLVDFLIKIKDIWLAHVVHVVFIYSILRLFVFFTFSFKFEFFIGILVLFSGVYISHKYSLREPFYIGLRKFLAYFYSKWKFQVYFNVFPKEGTWLIGNPRRNCKDTWSTWPLRMWYRWSVFYSLVYLMEPMLVLVIGLFMVLIAIYFQYYLLAYFIVFLINSGKVVANLGYTGPKANSYMFLRECIYNSTKYSLKISSWSIYFLEHRFLAGEVTDKGIDAIAAAYSDPVCDNSLRFPYTISEYTGKVLRAWLHNCAVEDGWSFFEGKMELVVFGSFYDDQKMVFREHIFDPYIEFDRYSNLAQFMYVIYFICLGYVIYLKLFA